MARLPTGWKEVKSSSGKTYYHNDATGETSCVSCLELEPARTAVRSPSRRRRAAAPFAHMLLVAGGATQLLAYCLQAPPAPH